MKRFVILLAIFMFASVSGDALADSLYRKQKEENAGNKHAKEADRSLVADRPAPPPPLISEHDLITVIVEEKTIGSGLSTSETRKSSELDFQVDKWFQINKGWKTSKPTVLPEAAGEAEFSTEGHGKSTRSSSLYAKIQAMVVQVYPNGNLLIEARKTVTLNHETEHLILTGVIRSEDVSSRTRQINSNKVFDLRVVYSGTGQVSDASSPGWLTRFLNRFWPF